MNEPLSVWHLVANASLTVQSVMLLLLLASVTSWFFIVQRYGYFRSVERSVLAFEASFWSGNDLNQLFREGDTHAVGMESLFRAGFKTFTRLHKQGIDDTDVVMEGVQRAMRVAISREEESMSKHIEFLATVGSVSPYVGLFGTVWGIMTSFQGLASVHQVTLAVVAPGISEALIATAMGLFAAIPAVVAYNRFAAKITLLLNKYDIFAEEFFSILHRQLLSQQQQRS